MTRTTTFIFLYVLLALTAAIVLAVPRPQAPETSSSATAPDATTAPDAPAASPDPNQTPPPGNDNNSPPTETDDAGVQDPTGKGNGKAGPADGNGNVPAAAPPAEAPEAGTGEQPPATDQQQPPPAAPPVEGGDPNADPNAAPPEQAPPPATPEQAPDASNGAEQPPPPAQDPAQEPQQPPAEAPPTGEQPPPTGEQPPPTDPSAVNPDPAQQEPPAEEPVEEPTQDDINEQETPEQVESEPEETANEANGGNGGNGGGSGGGQPGSNNVVPKDPSACSSDDECASGESCQDGTCAVTEEAPASDDDQGGSKVGKKVGISVGVICGIVGAGGLAFWVFRYMHHKRETDQYARNSIASFSSGGLAATPGLDNNASTLMVERRASKLVYPFSSPQAGFGNSDVGQSRYRLSLNYGGAGGVGASSTAHEYNDEGYTYDRGNGYAPGPQHHAEPATAPLMTLTPPPPVRAPEAPKTDRAIRPAANLAQSAQPVEPFEPVQLASSDNLPNSDSGSVHVVYTVANPEQAAQKQKELAAAAKTLTPTANSGMLRRNDSKRSNVRDSTISTGSSMVATNSVYLGIDKFLNTEDGYDDQDDDALSPNGNTGRYRMNSMYSTYSRDSSIFGHEGAPPLPSPLKSSFTNMPAGSSSQPSPPMLSKPALTTIGETPDGSSEGVSVSEVPRSSVFTLHAPIFKAYQASSEEEVPPLPAMPNSRY